MKGKAPLTSEPIDKINVVGENKLLKKEHSSIPDSDSRVLVTGHEAKILDIPGVGFDQTYEALLEGPKVYDLV